jgi:hypothetical protein
MRLLSLFAASLLIVFGQSKASSQTFTFQIVAPPVTVYVTQPTSAVSIVIPGPINVPLKIPVPATVVVKTIIVEQIPGVGTPDTIVKIPVHLPVPVTVPAMSPVGEVPINLPSISVPVVVPIPATLIVRAILIDEMPGSPIPPPPPFPQLPPTDPVVVDGCPPITITHNDVFIPANCPQADTILRTFTATDACGNVISRTQTIRVIDTTAPVISDLPGPTTIRFPAVPVFATPTVVDSCDPAPVLTFLDSVTPSTGHQSTTVRTWSAHDDCGNVAITKSQTISVIDAVAPPVFGIFPPDTTIECVK